MIQNNIQTKLKVLSSSFFPSIVSAFIDNTDILSLAVLFLAAALFRERAIYLLAPIYALQYFINEANHRISLITRKSLMDLVRERFGIQTSLLFGTLVLFSNLLLTTSLFLLLKEISLYVTFPVIYFYIYIFAFLLTPIFFKKLKSIRKLFLMNSILMLPLFAFLILGNVHFETVLRPISFSEITHLGVYPILAAIFGLSFPFWTHFFIGGYVSTNNISIHKLEYDKLEQRFVLIFSGIFQFLILLSFVGLLSFYKEAPPYNSFMKIVYDVFPTVLKLRSIPTILMVFSCLFGLTFISLSSSYIFGNFFGVEALPNQEISGLKSIKYSYLFLLILSFFMAHTIQVRTMSFVVFAGVFNFGLLLFLMFYLFAIGNTKDLMGRFRNTLFTNISMVITTILIVILFVLVILSYFFPTV